MKIQTRLTIVIFTIFLIGWLLAGILSFAIENGNARSNIINTAEMLLATASATRDYTAEQIEPIFTKQNSLETKTEPVRISGKKRDRVTLEPVISSPQKNDAFVRETVPSYASQEILARLSREYKGYIYHERALNPTNPQDLAEGWQVEIINNFIKNPNLQKQIGQRLSLKQTEILYIAQPIRVDSPNCLKCHSTPDIAPASLLKTYGRERGFNWKLNEIIGARIVCVPTSLQRQQAMTSVISYLLLIGSVFLVAYTAVMAIVNRSLIKPIEAIANLVEEISIHQTVNSQLPEEYPGSLGQLNRAINRLLISLRKSLGVK
jgi:hypothetical protein